MTDRCPACPLTDPRLIERFCSRCRATLSFWSQAERVHKLGNLLYEAKEYAAAADAYRACEAEVGLPAWFNLCLCLFQLEKYAESLEAIERAIAHEALPEALYLKGLVLRKLERRQEAQQILQQAEAGGWKKASAELSAMRMERLMGGLETGGVADSPDKKLAYLAGCLAGSDQLDENHQVQLLVEAGDAAVSAGDYALARRYFIRACQVKLSAETATRLAEFVLDYGAESEAEMAERWLMRALSLEGDHARAHYCLGRLQKLRGQINRSFHSLASALRANPHDEYVIFETAETAAEMGKISYCLGLLDRLDARAGDDSYWLYRARMLRRSIGAF
jgi:tetratricopeptide (TPR) repeat protein